MPLYLILGGIIEREASEWFEFLEVLTAAFSSQSSPLLLQHWYSIASTIGIDWIREITNCALEPRLTASPRSHVNAPPPPTPSFIICTKYERMESLKNVLLLTKL